MNEVLASLTALLGRLPILVVWVAALVLALVTWQRHRTAAALVAAASVIHLVAELVFTPIFTLLPMYVVRHGWSYRQLGKALAILTLASSLIHAAAYGLLVAAVFVRQKDAR